MKLFRDKGKETELSKYNWQMKNVLKNYKKFRKCMQSPINIAQGVLCLKGKYIVARADKKHLLNIRTEIISQCFHRNKYLIKNVR